MKPLVFLDFDGVCNSAEFRARFGFVEPLEPECLFDLLSLLNQTGADVVISSSWRCDNGWNTLEGMKENFVRAAIEAGCPVGVAQRIADRFIGMTLDFCSKNRAEEIFEWLWANEHTGPFVVLDDDKEIFQAPEIFMDRIVFTNDRLGITQSDVQIAIELLKGK